MGNSYMKRANLTASHGSRGLREYQQQDVSRHSLLAASHTLSGERLGFMSQQSIYGFKRTEVIKPR